MAGRVSMRRRRVEASSASPRPERSPADEIASVERASNDVDRSESVPVPGVEVDPPGEDAFAEPPPLSVAPPLALASLPPPPVGAYTLPASSEPFGAELVGREGLREPSIAPPALTDPPSELAALPPRLSLAPLPAESLEEPSLAVTIVPAATPSFPPEALELDLSVLGPSEHPLSTSEQSGVRSGIIEELDAEIVEELDEIELDETASAGEDLSRVAPPMPPERLRKAR